MTIPTHCHNRSHARLVYRATPLRARRGTLSHLGCPERPARRPGEPPPLLPDESRVLPEAPSPEARQWQEFGVVLALTWLPDFFYAVSSLRRGRAGNRRVKG